MTGFVIRSGFLNKFGLEAHRPEAIDLARNIMSITGIDEANIFHLGSDFY